MHLLSTLPSEGNLVCVAHLLYIARNAHLPQLLLFLLLGAVCHHKALLDIEELTTSSLRMLLILAFNRSAP